MNFLQKFNNINKHSSSFNKNESFFSKKKQDKMILTLRSFLLFSAILNTIVILDVWLLPVKITNTKLIDAYYILNGERITANENNYKYYAHQKNELLFRIETEKSYFSVAAEKYFCFNNVTEIKLSCSGLMNIIVGASTNNCELIKPYINLKGWFGLVPGSILLFGVIGLMLRRTNQFITFAALNIILMAIFFFILVLY